MRTGSVVLHELYFENLGGNGRADDSARSWLGTAVGQFDRWEAEFRRIAAGLLRPTTASTRQQFLAAMRSFAVDVKVRRATEHMTRSSHSEHAVGS